MPDAGILEAIGALIREHLVPTSVPTNLSTSVDDCGQWSNGPQMSPLFTRTYSPSHHGERRPATLKPGLDPVEDSARYPQLCRPVGDPPLPRARSVCVRASLHVRRLPSEDARRCETLNPLPSCGARVRRSSGRTQFLRGECPIPDSRHAGTGPLRRVDSGVIPSSLKGRS